MPFNEGLDVTFDLKKQIEFKFKTKSNTPSEVSGGNRSGQGFEGGKYGHKHLSNYF